MKIFNKQRFQILRGNRFTKYITYALGEIILVVIGILIALGISNWNEVKKEERQTLALKSRVLKQVDNDLVVIEKFQKELDTLQQGYLSILDRPYDESMVKPMNKVVALILEINTLSVDNSTTSMIENARLDDDEIARELIDMSGLYKLYLKDLDDVENVIFKTITENLKVIEQTEAWYADFITDYKCKDDCIKYLLHDKGHKSRMASLRFLWVDGYGGVIDSFHSDLLKSREELAKSQIHNEN